VLLSSGYIAGGAITGIIVAFMEGALPARNKLINDWSQLKNPFYSTADWNGLRADWLALIPFIFLCAYLYRVGREATRSNKRGTE
jgi:hypothetical protein